jgi:Flp pilus assembly protein TadD
MRKILLMIAFLSASAWAASAFEQGQQAYVEGNYEAAIKHFTEAAKENPKNAEVYYERSFVYDSLGNQDAVIADLTKAIEIDPNHSKAYNNRAIAYGQGGDLKQATKDARKACELKVCSALDFMTENGFLQE